MAGRHGYDGRPERQNEYFLLGDGISREVIQADICRYLGNDALVRPGTQHGRQGYIIRAYRNLTSEMISDLKADSARWEADVSRRVDLGYPRGSYITQDLHMGQTPNVPPTSYAPSTIHEIRQQQGPSPPTYSAAPAPPYVDSYVQPPYGASQNPPYQAPSSFSSGHSPYGSGQAPYPPPSNPYPGLSQPAVSAPEMHQYTYSSNTPYGYEGGRGNAPRYPGPGYENDSDYSPVTSGIAYPATTAPDPRIGVESRYTPESYPDRNRPQPTREREPHRRAR